MAQAYGVPRGAKVVRIKDVIDEVMVELSRVIRPVVEHSLENLFPGIRPIKKNGGKRPTINPPDDPPKAPKSNGNGKRKIGVLLGKLTVDLAKDGKLTPAGKAQLIMRCGGVTDPKGRSLGTRAFAKEVGVSLREVSAVLAWHTSAVLRNKARKATLPAPGKK